MTGDEWLKVETLQSTREEADTHFLFHVRTDSEFVLSSKRIALVLSTRHVRYTVCQDQQTGLLNGR